MTAAAEGVAAARPDGLSDKELHVGVASVELGTGAVRGFYAGQDYLAVPDQLGGRGRPGRLDVQAVRARGRDPRRLLAQGHLRRQLALRPARRPRGRERGQHQLRLGGQPDQGDRGLDQHRVHRPDARHGRRAAEDPPGDDGHGHPAGGADLEDPRLPEPDARPAADHRRHARQRDGQPDQHGQRATRRSANGRPPSRTSSRRSRTRTARRSTTTRWRRRTPSSRTSPPTSPTRCSRSCRPAPATAALGARPPGRRQDRHLDQRRRRRRLVLVHRLHPAARDLGHVRARQGQRAARRLAPAVLRRQLPGRDLDRGDEAGDGGVEVEEFPPPAYVDGEAPSDGHEPTPPPPTRTKTPKPTKTPSQTPTPRPRPRRPTPTPTPTPTATPPSSLRPARLRDPERLADAVDHADARRPAASPGRRRRGGRGAAAYPRAAG